MCVWLRHSIESSNSRVAWLTLNDVQDQTGVLDAVEVQHVAD